jgi:arginase
VGDAVGEGRVPIVLGGDHSIALGTLGGLAAAAGGPGAALWIDAHGDLNTPRTTPSGNVHGMPLAAALGHGGEGFASDAWPLPALDPARTTLIGVRSLDDGERALLGELDVAVHTMSVVDRRGIEPLVVDALARAAGAAFVHVSLDMDALDPEVAPGVGTAVRGGLSYREAHLAMELVAESGLLGSFEIVEVNPILDRENATAALAVELAASAFGARIL